MKSIATEFIAKKGSKNQLADPLLIPKNCRKELLRNAASLGRAFWPLIIIPKDSKDFSSLDILIVTRYGRPINVKPLRRRDDSGSASRSVISVSVFAPYSLLERPPLGGTVVDVRRITYSKRVGACYLLQETRE